MTPNPLAHRSVRMVLALLAAFALHAAYDHQIAIRSARPSLSLTALLTICLFTNSQRGAWLGFMVGLLEASYASRFIGSYIVTRTLAGFLVGLLEEWIFRDNALVALATAFVGTLFVDTCFYLFAPQPHALGWFISTFHEGIYNAVLAIPLYYLFKKLVPRRSAR